MPPSRSERISRATSGSLTSINDRRWVIKKHKFDQLRSNPHFVTMIRIGRLMNALLFSQDLLLYDHDRKKSTDRRHWPRALQVNAGYIHEALEVFGSIESKYANEDFFRAALKLSRPSDADGKRRKKMMRTVRDSGFHLDKADSITSKTLSKMKAEDYFLFSGDDGKMGTMHFDLSDEVDLMSWVDVYRTDPNQTPLDILIEISNAMVGYMSDTVRAADEIIQGLLLKLGFTLTKDSGKPMRPKKRKPRKVSTAKRSA